MSPLPIGLFGLNMGVFATDPQAMISCARLAEDLGYDSIWVGEHVVLPAPRIPPAPLGPDYPILDPLPTLALLASHTTSMRLATGIIILPQRNPVVLAKELASLDVLSGGRLIFGLGVGYVEPEMRAVGVPIRGRGLRADEYLRAMRSLWEDDQPSFEGQYTSFQGIDAHPRPVQRPVPTVIAGHAPAALRRAVRYGHGWYGFRLDRPQSAELITSLRTTAAELGRDLSDFSITISPSEPLTPEVIADFAAMGATRLVALPGRGFWQRGYPLESLIDFIHRNAPSRPH